MSITKAKERPSGDEWTASPMIVLHRHTVQQHSQEQRILDFVSPSLQFIHVPVNPDELSLEKFGFRRGKPKVEVSWKFD